MSSTGWVKSKGLTGEVDSRGQLAAWLLSATDACLAGVLFVAPFAFGARHPAGRLLLVSLCVGAALAWFARRTIANEASRRHTAFFFVLLAACGLLVLQITPLPVSMLKTFGAQLSELLPLWNGSAGLGRWQTISVTPEATKESLANLIAFCLLFVTVVERLKTTDDVNRLLRWIAYATGAMAVFALLQLGFSNGKYFWIYELPYCNTLNRPRGSFTNSNHLASFLTLGIGAQIHWFMTCMMAFYSASPSQRHSTRGTEETSSSKARLQLVGSTGLLLVTVLAILLSLSRGGLAALCVGGLVTGVLYYKTGMLRGRHLAASVAMTTLVVGVLSIYGYDQITNRLAEFTTQEAEEIDTLQSRLAIWRANLKAIPVSGLCGFGVGSHREVYPAFIEKSFPVEFTHAENGYLQVSTENGVCGMVLLAITILFPIFWSGRALRDGSALVKNCTIAAIAGLASFLVHALVDFVWYVPACLAVALLLGACLLRLAQQSESDSSSAVSARSSHSWSLFMEGAVCSLAGVWAAVVLFGPALASPRWDEYLITSQTKEDYVRYQATRPEPSTESPLDYQRFLTKNMIEQLRDVVEREPSNARAHLRLAANYLTMFELIQIDSANPMPISEIRSAAIASQFASAKQLADWLHLAIGKHSELLYLARRHTYRALQLCPLQGDAYLYLAKLGFLEGKGVEAIDEYLQQAMALRPHAGDVLFTVGQELLLTGRVEQALDHWQAHFEEIGPLQGTIFQILAGSFAAESLIEAYNPNWNSLLVLWNHYSQAGTQEDLLAIERRASQLIRNESDSLPPHLAARAWRLYAEIQTTLGMQDEAIRTMRKGLEAAPGDYPLRRQLAEILTAAEMYEEADPHLRWCLAQHPEDGAIRQMLSDSRKAWFEQRTALRQEPLFR